MNRKQQKIAINIMAVIVSLAAVFGGLMFTGAIPSWKCAKDSAEPEQENPVKADEARTPMRWEIRFKGMEIAMEEKGTAYIHESGCLNIRLSDDYLIQIDIEDDTVEGMWGRIDQKMEDLTADGYRIEREPEKVAGKGNGHVRYVISRENERGADFKRIYSEICLIPADSGRHFLVVIRYDGRDVEILDEETKNGLYDKAFADVKAILEDVRPSEEPDDKYGSYWMVEENISPGNTCSENDSMTYDDETLTLTYGLPGKCYLTSDDAAGKTYFDEENRIYVRVSVTDYTWESAEKKAEKHSSAGFSKIHEQGQVEINNKIFYYYTYSVLECSKTEKKYHYYFHAFCDLENGDIFTIFGNADDNPLAMDENYYYNVMDICE